MARGGETQVTKVIGSVPHFVGSDKAGHLAAPGLGDIEPNLNSRLVMDGSSLSCHRLTNNCFEIVFRRRNWFYIEVIHKNLENVR